MTFVFFFNDTAATEIYTLSLHDALPILMVLVHTGVEGARVVADKVRTGVEVMGRDLGYPEGLVTVSIGVAELAPGRGPEREDVLVEADRALYRAKAMGRNQVATGAG